jgi:FkbM family methyltransferase
MYDQFRWTNVSARRNGVTIEYEPVQPFFLLALAETSECRTFLDIGASIGVYSLFASVVPTVDRIVAFEANPETSRELARNVSLNSLQNRVEVVGKAVSSSPGPLTFGVVSKYSGANSVIDTTIHDRATFHKEVSVDAVTLDGFFQQAPPGPICMKIDVEGHEREVIDGGRSMFTANQAVLQLEGYDQAGNSIVQLLEELGYYRMTNIGPDHYFSNIASLLDPAKVIEVYERALEQMIAWNHRNKAIILKRGDIGIQLTGRTATVARNLAKRLIGRHL